MKCGICSKELESLSEKKMRNQKFKIVYFLLYSKIHKDLIDHVLDYLNEGTFLFDDKMIFCFLNCPFHKAVSLFKFLFGTYLENNLFLINTFFKNLNLKKEEISEIFKIYNFQIIYNSRVKYEKSCINFKLNNFFRFFYEKYNDNKEVETLNLFDWDKISVKYFFGYLRFLVLVNKNLKD